jgi:hypothetical protein
MLPYRTSLVSNRPLRCSRDARQRAALIPAHQVGVADDICSKDCCQSSLFASQENYPAFLQPVVEGPAYFGSRCGNLAALRRQRSCPTLKFGTSLNSPLLGARHSSVEVTFALCCAFTSPSTFYERLGVAPGQRQRGGPYLSASGVAWSGAQSAPTGLRACSGRQGASPAPAIRPQQGAENEARSPNRPFEHCGRYCHPRACRFSRAC